MEVPISPGDHLVHVSGSRAAFTIHRSDQVLDFTNVRLSGTRSSDQEHYTGIGIEFSHCKNLTIRNLRVRGYLINMQLTDCQGVQVENCDFSYSHSEKILDEAGQPINKFLTLRDIGAWRGYGAGIWLRGSTDCKLIHCRALDSMNGVVLENSNQCTLYDNDFSYNSAWGLALWQSSQNQVSWNHLDFCNRPWAGGWGGDAAALAVVASSNKNLFVGNSMTHGGDGFFLADVGLQGDDTAAAGSDRFTGHCDGNVVWRNDGSWSPNNAFESTFSANNQFGENIADDSGYGFWLGYSSANLVAANQIERELHDGIAIEHGQKNMILANRIEDCNERAVHLWTEPNSPATEPPSSDNVVAYNRIQRAGQGLDLQNSKNTDLVKNDFQQAPLPANMDTTSVPPATGWSVPPEVVPLLKQRPVGWQFYRETDLPKGFEWIRPSTYAPNRPTAIATSRKDSYTFEIWTVFEAQDVKAPDWVTVKQGANRHYWTATGGAEDEVGETRHATITLTGSIKSAKGPNPVSNTLRLPFRTGYWDCRWFAWNKIPYDDKKGWAALFDSKPIAVQKLTDLSADYSYRSPLPGVVPIDHFALLATRAYKFEGGLYDFSTISDDGIRVLLDDKQIISRWTHHGASSDQSEQRISAGIHTLRVEYFQEDGAAVIQVDWNKIGA
jgi:parallel beta-helix repeat protein